MVKKRLYWKRRRSVQDLHRTNSEDSEPLLSPTASEKEKEETETETDTQKETASFRDTISHRVLKANNFVADWDGTLEVLEHRMLQHNCQALRFVDVVPAETLRRWNYQKIKLCRKVTPMLQQHADWQDQPIFQTTVQISLESHSVETITNDFLGEVQKDPEIVSLRFTSASQSDQELVSVVFALVGLLSLRDRPWQRIRFQENGDAVNTSIQTNPEGEVELISNTEASETATSRQCRRVLQEASETYHVPIEWAQASTSLKQLD